MISSCHYEAFLVAQ